MGMALILVALTIPLCPEMHPNVPLSGVFGVQE